MQHLVLQLHSPNLQKWLLVIIIGFSFNSLYASHIVGGFMTYKCTGGNTYEFTMRFYRDSVNGNVPYNDSVEVDIFYGDGTLFKSMWVKKGPTELIPIDTGNICITIPPNILIQTADYTDAVHLPPDPRGYSLVYSMCCRNRIISNIANPSSQPSVWSTTIPPNDTTCNNTPQITSNPPIALCLNRPMNFQIETAEPDGDSLHFEICSVLKRLPSTSPPPFTVIPYLSLIPGNPPFQVDPATGTITGRPTQQGHYVIAICVREYRDGVPMSTVQLDYQFNVTNCLSIFSDMITQYEDSSLYCAGLTMNFTDQSQNASNVFWDFGDTTTLTDTSSLRNPTYTYPAPGTYTVRLIAGPGNPCSDTAYEAFDLVVGFTQGFNKDSEYCFYDQPVSLTPYGNYPDSVQFEWDFGPAATPRYAYTEVPPPVSWSLGGSHLVKFTVIEGKCEQEIIDTVLIRPDVFSDLVDPSENQDMLCNGLTIPFVSQSLNADSIYWDFGDPASTSDHSSLDSSSYTYPQAGIYRVKLIASNNGKCFDSTYIDIEVHEELDPQMIIDGQNCFEAQDMNFFASGNYPPGTRYTWVFGPEAISNTAQGAMVNAMEWTVPGKYPVKLMVEKGYCSAEIFDTVEIPRYSVPVDAGDTQYVYRGEVIALGSTPSYDYYWSSSHPVIFSSAFTQFTTAQLSPTSDSIIKFYVKVTDSRGCEGLDSTYVIVRDRFDDRGYNVITPNGDGFNDYLDLSGFIEGGQCGLVIMNRWGAEVYTANQYDNNWQGTNNQGEQLPDGTYYYVVYCRPYVKATGPITIIRTNYR